MHRNTRFLTLLLAAAAPALAACDQTSVGPDAVVDLGDVAAATDAELDISVNPGLTAAAVEAAEVALGPQRGPGPRARIKNAREHFENARRRYAAGDPAGAKEAGQQARNSLSDALIEGLGADEVGLMIAETDAVVAGLLADGAAFSNPVNLAATLSGLADSAKADQQNGQARAAGEKMVRARQHTDRARRDGVRDHDRPNDVLSRDVIARLKVSQGAHSIALAWRLIGDAPTELQARLMDTATELQRKAEAALAEGDLGRAASLSHHAEIKALQAVVGSDEVTQDVVDSVTDLAEQLLAEAGVVVGAGASAVDLAVFEIANRLFAGGLEKLASGNNRGLVLLWHSATLSAVLIG